MEVRNLMSPMAALGDTTNLPTAESQTTGNQTSQNPGSNPLGALAADYNNFLQLLTTQLQNQDPLDPLDANEFTQQLVAFSSVEQMIQSNKRLDHLIALQSATNAYGAASFLGNTVAVNDDHLSLQDGKASYEYTIDRNASKALITIYDKNGQTVLVKEADRSVGTHHVDWDGKDVFGNQLPDGEYRVAVSYQDENGDQYSAPIVTFGVVDAAELKNGEITLYIGSVGYPAADIVKITSPQ